MTFAFQRCGARVLRAGLATANFGADEEFRQIAVAARQQVDPVQRTGEGLHFEGMRGIAGETGNSHRCSSPGKATADFYVPQGNDWVQWCGDTALLLDETWLVDLKQQKNGWQYTVEQPKTRPMRPKAYADNFAYNRVGRWTH